MPNEIEVDVAEANLSELLTKVEAGADVVLSRGSVPIARVTKIPRHRDVERVIEEIRELRKGIPPTTIEEILAWRDEGRR